MDLDQVLLEDTQEMPKSCTHSPQKSRNLP